MSRYNIYIQSIKATVSVICHFLIVLIVNGVFTVLIVNGVFTVLILGPL